MEFLESFHTSKIVLAISTFASSFQIKIILNEIIRHMWQHAGVVITTAQLHSSTTLNPAGNMSEICNGKNHWWWSQLETRLNVLLKINHSLRTFFIITIYYIINPWQTFSHITFLRVSKYNIPVEQFTEMKKRELLICKLSPLKHCLQKSGKPKILLFYILPPQQNTVSKRSKSQHYFCLLILLAKEALITPSLSIT